MSNFIDLLSIYKNAPPIQKMELILTIALFIGGATIASVIGFDRFSVYLSELQSQTATIVSLFSLFLFIATMILILSHVVTFLLEINFVSRFYESIMPQPHHGVILIAGAIAILLAMLTYLSNKLFWFSLIYFVFIVFDIIGVTMLSNNIEQRLAHLPSSKRKNVPSNLLSEVRLYYVERPWRRLGVFRLLIVATEIVLMIQHLDIAAYSRDIVNSCGSKSVSL
jgi:hypothetical protein